MDHMKLSDELRQQLLESAAWGKAGITPTLTEAKTEDSEEEVIEAVLFVYLSFPKLLMKSVSWSI